MSEDNGGKSKVVEIKREPLNTNVVLLAKAALELAESYPDASEMTVFIKVGDEFKTMSTVQKNTREYIAMLEIAKHHCLRHMMP